MNPLAEYVLSVISASMIAAIICSFFDGKTGICSMVKLVCGLFLTFVVVNPLVELDFSRVTDHLEQFSLDGQDAAAVGENMAREAEADIIKAGVQAYILDKAKFWGTQLEVEVVLDQENIPVGVELEGKISPYARARMEEAITENLGISKEHQLWIG